MYWKTITLKKLRAAKLEDYHDGNGPVVRVNADEAVLLRNAGAEVTEPTGFLDSERQMFQIYSFEEKTYFWLAGYGSGNPSDAWPIRDTTGFAFRGALNGLMGL